MRSTPACGSPPSVFLPSGIVDQEHYEYMTNGSVYMTIRLHMAIPSCQPVAESPGLPAPGALRRTPSPAGGVTATAQFPPALTPPGQPLATSVGTVRWHRRTERPADAGPSNPKEGSRRNPPADPSPRLIDLERTTGRCLHNPLGSARRLMAPTPARPCPRTWPTC